MPANFKPELLELVPISAIGTYITDPDYGLQEKYNGKRRTVFKDGKTVYALNKEGVKREVEPVLYQQIMRLPYQNIIFEAEQIKMHYKVFDLLMVDSKPFAQQPYTVRMKACERVLGSQSWCDVVQTAITEQEKYALAAQLIKDHAEGVVIKRLDAPYGSGQHRKIKFIKTLDAVVIGPNPEGHDSVEIGLYDDAGKLIRIGGCSTLGKEKVKKGDVIEIIYLYGTATNHAVQPRMTVKRDDKKPKDCKLSQLKINRDMK